MSEANARTPAEELVEQAVELLVYAPIGLLFEGSTVLPTLVEKGRSQVTLARMVGRYAVRNRGAKVTRAAGRVQDQLAGVLDLFGDAVTPRQARPAARPAAATPDAPPATPARPKPVAAVPTAPDLDVEALAIPGYDALSASQVVNRLAGLSQSELEAVRDYEAASRGRKTILSKVAQLQEG